MILLVLLAIFFGVPLLWLAIAPSKLHNELVTPPSLAFGELSGTTCSAWDHLMSYNDGQILAWAWNSVWYTAAAP